MSIGREVRRAVDGGTRSLTLSTTTSVFQQLPLETWARRFTTGSIVLCGRAPAASMVGLRGDILVVPRGDVRLQLRFRGGDSPTITWASLEAGAVRAIAEGDDAGRLASRISEVLHDVAIEATGTPEGELLVRFATGMRFSIPADALVTASGATRGPCDAPQLAAPLVFDFGGAGVRISHTQLRFLSRLARVQISRCTLHPDGSIHLESDAAEGVGRFVRAGLNKASMGLSHMLRRNPNFARVRSFLQA